MKSLLTLGILLLFAPYLQAQNNTIITGAEQTSEYFGLLKDKRIAVVVNPTSVIGKTLLVDSLLHAGIRPVKIFAPEHGFRGSEDAGANISDDYDSKTALPVVSLYGKKHAPDSTDLANVDMVIYDIQDVGVRFFTYITTLQLVMESCARYHKPLLVLDRPDPNGYFIDGPVLDKKFKSFVGMQPIPVVYSLTPAEYALLLNGEHWLADSLQCELHVVKCIGYTHKTLYNLPVKPSPNLVNMVSVYMYPTLCLFEGTPVSVGRGTDIPFQVFGYPTDTVGGYYFTPVPMPGATKPPYMNERCRGYNVSYYKAPFFVVKSSLFLNYIIDTYNHYPDKNKFFNNYFDTLAGTDLLRRDIIAGKSEDMIRLGWRPAINVYKKIRKKYLLYEDFE